MKICTGLEHQGAVAFGLGVLGPKVWYDECWFTRFKDGTVFVCQATKQALLTTDIE